MRSKTPQEKKVLSLKKDRRNDYGGNDKASRKAIPKRKAEVNRNYRRKVDKVLKHIEPTVTVDAAFEIEAEIKSVKRSNWKKWPDIPLGEMIERKLDARVKNSRKGKSERKKVRAFVESLVIDSEQIEPGRWKASIRSYPEIYVYADRKERPIEKLRHLATVAKRNELGLDIRVLIDGEFITPKLSK